MGKYILQRILVAIPVIFGVTVVAFFIMTLAGDAVDMLISPGLSPEDIELKKKSLDWTSRCSSGYCAGCRR